MGWDGVYINEKVTPRVVKEHVRNLFDGAFLRAAHICYRLSLTTAALPCSHIHDL